MGKHCQRNSSLFQFVFIMLIAVMLISGCASIEPAAPGTPIVTQEQAKSVAQEVYGITQVKEINIRHLTEDELKLRNEEQSQLTPVYYIINGLIEDEQVTIYVSSNEIKH